MAKNINNWVPESEFEPEHNDSSHVAAVIIVILFFVLIGVGFGYAWRMVQERPKEAVVVDRPHATHQGEFESHHLQTMSREIF